MEIHKSFAAFIKNKRKEKRVPVQDLARKAGISRAYIYLIEKEENNPSILTAEQILMALEESWESFIAYARAAAVER